MCVFISIVDVALLELITPLTFTNAIKPIKLANVDDVYVPAGTLTLVSGWGLTHNPEESQEVLRAVYVSVVDQEVCEEAYNTDHISIEPHEICAGDFEHGGKDREFH